MADARKTTKERLNADQLEAVCKTIAGRMATLQQLIMIANSSCHEEFERSACTDAAEALATSIGAMADQATGGDTIGDTNRWNYGPHFAELGKEASHG